MSTGTLSYSIYLSHAIVQVAFSMVAHYGFGLSYVTVGDVTFIGSNIIVGDLLYCLMLATVFGVSGKSAATPQQRPRGCPRLRPAAKHDATPA